MNAEATKGEGTKGALILVVDDDPDIRDAVCMVLEGAGYRAMQAINGRDALELLSKPMAPRPSLVLLDMMMPVMDGAAFRLEQRKNAALASIPTVVFSAYGNAEQAAESVEAAGYLSKPLRLDLLLDVVSRCVHGSFPTT